MITNNERKALHAIVKSEYQDGGDPVNHDVWTRYCNPFGNKKTLAGVYASLSKKRFIQTSHHENGAGRQQEDIVCITAAGFAAYQSNVTKGAVMKAKTTSIKSTKSAAAKNHAFRVVLRGTVKKGKKEMRVRHVFTTQAPDEGAAVLAAQKAVVAVIKEEGLTNEYLAVFPPLGKAA